MAGLSVSWAERFARTESGAAPPPVPHRPGRLPDQVSTPSVALTPAPDAHLAPEVRPLPTDVRHRLREVAGPGAEKMEVRTGPSADALTRTHHADAVTVGTTVHVRDGQFRPTTRSGFALLAHEAHHVTALLQPHRTSAHAEETQARRIEHQAATHPLGPSAIVPTRRQPQPRPNRSTPTTTALTRTAPATTGPTTAAPEPRTQQIKAADVDRELPTPAAGPDLEALRRGLVEDVMRRLRTDFERGA
nr:DUF4157 domain-containing protein [Kineosporia babensis]